MRALFSRLVIAAVCCLCACTTTSERPSPKPDAEAPAAAALDPKLAEEIARLEDRRDALGRLTELCSNDAPAVRARALLALGRIQDVRTLETVLSKLADPDATVRTEAAFATGLMLQSWEPLPEGAEAKIVDALVVAEEKESEASAKQRMLEALGKASTAIAEERLRSSLTGSSPEIVARAGLSLGLIARRGGKLDERSVVAALGLLSAASPQPVRYAGSYTLAFSKSAQARPALVACLEDPDADVRALCARGLAEVGTPEDVPTLRKHLADLDPRVAVEVVRALLKAVDRCAALPPPAAGAPVEACAALDALTDTTRFVDLLVKGNASAGNQPLLAFAQAGLPAFGREKLALVRHSVRSALSKAPTADLAWLDCRFAAAQDRISGQLAEVLNCGNGLVPEARRLSVGLREIARTPPTGPAAKTFGDRAVGYLTHASPLVRNAALEAIAATKPDGAAAQVKPLMGGEDPIVAANSAFVLAALGARDAYAEVLAMVKRVPAQPELAPIADALADLAKVQDPKTPDEEASQKARAEEASAELRTWLASPHASVRTAASSALEKLGSPKQRPDVTPFPANSEPLPTVPAGATLTFETTKGTFVVALDTKQAPLTSANLFGLAKRGYFDGIMFHRVVPDFVAQGGDPRGDGEGGPGYAIRCEMTHRSYVRGAFGMALSGKDTGGSQFFVTTSPQPHLDGRYTNFGEVKSGMDVVDRLIEGDRMLKVTAAH